MLPSDFPILVARHWRILAAVLFALALIVFLWGIFTDASWALGASGGILGAGFGAQKKANKRAVEAEARSEASAAKAAREITALQDEVAHGEDHVVLPDSDEAKAALGDRLLR